jgi:hypothetical protein
MTIDELIDNLILDYRDYGQKRHNAVWRCDTEYVARLDQKMRVVRGKLDAAMQVKQNENDLEEHELIKWAKSGYPPVVACERPQRLPRNIFDEKPTAADWRRVALRYAETGSKEDYELMLTLVRLDHPVPNLWSESEPVKTTSKTTGSLTLEDVWYGSRWYVLIFAIWAVIIVVSINILT